MAIILPGANTNALQMAMTRNRTTSGRRSDNPLDIYMSKGQIIVRQMPRVRVDFPSEKLKRSTAALVREREIEKMLDIGDIQALRWRANKSRFNWWEVLGKIVISKEYNEPGSVSPVARVWFKKLSVEWQIIFNTDINLTCYVLDFGTVEEYQANHYWRYTTHRMAGMTNILRGEEVLKYKLIPIYSQPYYAASQTKCLRIRTAAAKPGHIIMVRPTREYPPVAYGESGLLYWTRTRPWWLDAPFPFMP